MRKWLSIVLVRLATRLYPENIFVQEFFMKMANEQRVQDCFKGDPYETTVVTTWEKFSRDMLKKRLCGKQSHVYGVKRGLKTTYTFATFGNQIETLPETEYRTPAQIYSDGDQAEMEGDRDGTK